jgi:C1A family cysteine protease
MRKTRIGAALFFAACIFLSASLSLADEISQVRSAIIARQANWQAGETSMTPLSSAERRARLGLMKPALPVGAEMMVTAEPPIVGAPASLDWRNNSGNFVTPVRNQLSCGSCWAFATTAALESAVLRAENTPGVDLNLSEQVLISCGTSTGGDAGGCDGGYINRASDYIRDIGLPLETCYPYTATDGTCSSACSTYQSSTHQITGWGYVTTTSPTVSAIRDALVSYGPLATTMDVYEDFYSYSSGVYSYTSGAYEGGHAILLVGYSDAGQYFIVKNSWGPGWGESGYFKIAYSELGTVVKFGDYTIRYSGSSCSYSVTPSSKSLGQPAGSGSVTVTTQGGCAWTAVSNAGWITVTSGASGTGNGTVDYSVTANAGAKARSGTLTIAGKTFTVTQAGVPPTITTKTPAPGATGVAVDTLITVAFSESMNASSYLSSASITPAVAGGLLQSNFEAVQASFQPSASLAYNTTYTVTISTNLSDDEGVHMTSPVSWSFTTSAPPPSSGSSGSSGGGGCFIATAAFGSALEPRVVTLREFRDVYLAPSLSGRAFVELSYALSPPVADVIAADEGLKSGVRAVLAPVVSASETLLGAGREAVGLIGWFGAAIILVCGAGRGRRRDDVRPDKSH